MQKQKLSIRFNKETIEEVLSILSNDGYVNKSEVARHAMAFGLANLVVARNSMTSSEFSAYIENESELLSEVISECR